MFVVAGAVPATAHTELVSSSPSDKAELDSPPAVLELTFSEDLLPETVSIAVQGADAKAVALTDVQVVGPQVTAAWPAAVTAGPVAVNYRVVSADGHPVQGALAFTLGPAASTDPSPPVASGSPAVPTAAEPGSSSLVPPIAAISLGLGIGVAIGLAFYLRSRRSS